MIIKTLCVFCGAKSGNNPEIVRLAEKIGQLLAEKGISIVYGGSDCGLMGAVTEGSIAAGGNVVGVFPDLLTEAQPPHLGLANLIRTPCLSSRKQKMVDISDSFLILPGGYGTMDEIFEIVVLHKLNAHKKPMILMNPKGFWDPMLQQIQRMVDHGFVEPSDHHPFIIVEDLESFQAELDRFQCPPRREAVPA